MYSAALIAIFALVRRHRPAVDHFTIVVALCIVTEMLAAMLFTAFVAPSERQLALTLIWAATALVIALAIAVRMVVVIRSPRDPQPRALADLAMEPREL